MFQQRITVTYNDGTIEEVTTTQADVAAWEMWAVKRGLKPTAADRSLMQDLPVVFMRFVAWNATYRAVSPRVDFDIWGDTVSEVMVVDETPDPTPATTSATSSES